MSEDVTELLTALEARSGHAAEQLLPLVYGELRRLAAAKLAKIPAGQTLQATALVHEAWLRVQKSSPEQWKNRAHFFAAAAEAMRRILVEQARRKSAIKHGGGKERVLAEVADITSEAPEDRLLLIHDALDQLAERDATKAEIVKLKFFVGLRNEDIANVMGISDKTVRRQWNDAKLKLLKIIESDPS